MIKKIDHLVITTTNLDKCFEFYQKLGFVPKTANGRYELFAGDFKINVHLLGKELTPHADNVAIGSADLCFEIKEDINKIKSLLESNGLTIELGVVERKGVNGIMNSIYLRDYDKNLIELCSYD